jgi:hypothetical protein
VPATPLPKSRRFREVSTFHLLESHDVPSLLRTRLINNTQTFCAHDIVMSDSDQRA